MSGRYYLEIHQSRAHIRALYIVIALLGGLLFYAIWGWKSAPRDIRVYIPPDLRTGGVFHVGDVPTSVIYVFAHYIFQQLNTWRDNGQEDYARNIYNLKHFMTSHFQVDIQKDLQLRSEQGELRNRTRRVEELPGGGFSEEKVKILGDGRWEVVLEYDVREEVNHIPVKETRVQYVLKVVQYKVDPEKNPWGLALDGFKEPPKRMEEEGLGVRG
ncbi:MAG: TIGR03746 family integrating conjugative element protein [Gammaproteobacteria bacterium]|nr:TIGR03746 family integrating conjugative element protein [Gammaproteobacteria bacterium]